MMLNDQELINQQVWSARSESRVPWHDERADSYTGAISPYEADKPNRNVENRRTVMENLFG